MNTLLTPTITPDGEENAFTTIVRNVDYNDVVGANYQGFDLEGHGLKKLPADLLLLDMLFKSNHDRIRNGRVLILGVGPGRLATAIATLAKKHGAEHVTFNDFLSHHVETTRQRIGKTLGDDTSFRGMQIGYSTGDLMDENVIGGQFDYILSLWFVDGELMPREIHQMEAVGDYLEARRGTRKRFADLLRPNGAMTIESPFSGVGKYAVDREEAVRVLTHLPREIAQRLILTSFVNENEQFGEKPPSDMPQGVKSPAEWHLRAAHGGTADVQSELAGTGLELVNDGVRILPDKIVGATVNLDWIARVTQDPMVRDLALKGRMREVMAIIAKSTAKSDTPTSAAKVFTVVKK